jgi:hypothetical protein
MRPFALVCVLACLLAACTGDSSGGGEPTTTTTSTVPSTTSTSVADDAGLCHSYLVLLETGDEQPLRETLDDVELEEKLDTMLSSEGEFQAIAQAALDLERAIVDRCAPRYSADLAPAPSDGAALEAFAQAVVAGDEGSAEPIAWDHVMAQLAPWSPLRAEGAGGGPDVTIEGDTATIALEPGIDLVCRAQGGVVVSCSYAE